MNPNPFVCGTPVFGNTFFGRKKELSQLWSRMISPHQPGCCAVVGETRIGKSSLKEEFLRRVRAERPGNTIVVSLNVASDFQKGTTIQFYQQLISHLTDELRSVESLDSQVFSQMIESSVPWHRMLKSFKKFLKSINSLGIRLLVVFDEFDYMDQHFEFDPQGWNVLRDLAYEPFSPLVYLTLSRRPLREIENDLRISSNFWGIFGEHIRLGRFSVDEARQLITEPLRRHEVVWPSALPATITELTGGHPYLTQLVCFDLYESLYHGEPLQELDLPSLKIRFRDRFFSLFRELQSRLERKNMFQTLLKITYGLDTSAEAANVDELIHLGYLDRDVDGTYRPFSPLFEAYLRSFRFSLELWPVLGRTELALRRMVEDRYQTAYGENWLDVVASNNKLPKSERTVVDTWREAQKEELKNPAILAGVSLSLIDYSYLDQLRQLIFQKKELFQDFLGASKSAKRYQVDDAISQAASVRNPQAHFRPVNADEITKTQLACQVLLEAIPKEYLQE